MDHRAWKKLSTQIALRLWLVCALTLLIGLALLQIPAPMPVGAALLTIAGLAAPIAVLASVAAVLRRPAHALPDYLSRLGILAVVGGVGWLVVSPGDIPAIITLALGVWCAVVGLIAGLFTSRNAQ